MLGLFGFPAILDLRPDCGTWRVGELAVCINDRWPQPNPADPKVGDVLRVAGVRDMLIGRGCWTTLFFEGKPRDHSWSGNAFRKPVTDETGASDEIAQRIKAARPARVPESV